MNEVSQPKFAKRAGWIFALILLTVTTVFLLLQLMGILTEDTIFLVSFVVGLFLFFVFFPVVVIYSLRKNVEGKEQIITNIGLFSVMMWMCGFLMIQFRIPGKPAVVVLSAFFFMFNFLPGWYFLRKRNREKVDKFFITTVVIFSSVLMLAAISKLQGWPIRDFLGKLSIYVLLLLLLPATVLCYYKRKGFVFSLKESLIFLFFTGHTLAFFQVAKIRDERYSNTTEHQERAEKNLALFKGKSDFIYQGMDRLPDSDMQMTLLKNKAELLKTATDSINTYIHHIKSLLVSTVDGVPISQADTTRFEQIDKKTDRDKTTFVLLGNNLDSLKTGKYSALDLKRRLLEYSSTVTKILPEDAQIAFSQNNPIRIEDKKEWEDGLQKTWEFVHFLHAPLGTVFTDLTSIQADIRYAEMLAVNELFNHATVNDKNNVAAQLAELAMKFEAEKKERQIALLEKDQELSEARLQAKDKTISKKEETIIYFVMASVVFVLMILLIIRSNYLRRKANLLLQQQKEEISRQKLEVEEQKHLVEEKQNEILDSIKYAKRLQEAILPPKEFIDRHLPENFIFYQPKDVVAGDFYWAERQNDQLFIAAADSTGHGVPGALVSVVCSNALNRSVKEFKEQTPGGVLDRARALVIETFEKSASEVKDGMDISLLCIDEKNKKITWSGANNPLWYVLNGKLYELSPSKQPIGVTENPRPFETQEIPYQPGTVFYLFTDGFADQFGGPFGKKFKYRPFQDFLLSIQHLPMPEQAATLSKRFHEWRGSLEQVERRNSGGTPDISVHNLFHEKPSQKYLFALFCVFSIHPSLLLSHVLREYALREAPSLDEKSARKSQKNYF